MRTRTLATAIAISLALPAASIGQQPAPANSNAQTTTSAGVQTNDASQYQDFSAFLDKFGSADFSAANSSLEGTSTYSVLALSSLQGADMTKLQTEMDRHQEDLGALRAKVAQNQEAVASLEDEGLTPENVVWAEKGQNDTILLFVTDKTPD